MQSASPQPNYSADVFGNLFPDGGAPVITNQGDQVAADGSITPAADFFIPSWPSLPWWAWLAVGVVGVVIVKRML